MEDTTKSQLAFNTAKGATIISFSSATFQEEGIPKENVSKEKISKSSNFDVNEDAVVASPSYTQTSNTSVRRRKLPVPSQTRISTHKSSRTSLRQINRNREKWTSAALLVGWVFLISSLLATLQLSACGAGAGSKNDKEKVVLQYLKMKMEKDQKLGEGTLAQEHFP